MRQPLFIAVFLLITVKVVGFVCLGPAAIKGDAQGYWELSSLVQAGDIMMLGEPIAYRTPIYPWFLASLRTIAQPFSLPLLAIVIAQAVLYLATVFLAGELAVRISRQPVARLLATLTLLPAVSALTYLGFLVTEVLFVFLLMLNLVCMMSYQKQSNSLSATLVGLTFGLTLLTRPVVLMLWIPHASFLVLAAWSNRYACADDVHPRATWKGRIVHAVVAGAVVVAMCMPWLARNNRLFGDAFLTEFLGRNIWIVTFQDGSGAGLPMPESQPAIEIQKRIAEASGKPWSESNWRHTWTVSHLLTASGLNDPESDRLMKTVAVEAMKSDLPTVAYKTLRRIVNFWRCPANDLPPDDPRFNGFDDYPQTWSTQSRIVRNTTGLALRFRVSQSVSANTALMVVVGLACLFLVWHGPTRVHGLWIISILAYFSVITGIVEIPDYRYRMVVEPLCAVAVGSTLAILWARRHERNAELLPEPTQ